MSVENHRLPATGHTISLLSAQPKQRWWSSRRRKAAAYLALQNLTAAEESWTEQQVEIFQLTQLRRTIRLAEGSCPYYQQKYDEAGLSYLDLHTAEDLGQFPTITIGDVATYGNDMISRPGRPSRGWRSLATQPFPEGKPTAFDDQMVDAAYLTRLLKRFGYQPSDRTVTIETVPASNRRWTLDLSRNTLTLPTTDFTVDHLDETADRVLRYAPQFLVGPPSVLTTLALRLADLHHRGGLSPIDRTLRGVLGTGELLVPSQQRFLQTAFRSRVVGSYVSTVPFVRAFQTPTSNLYYFAPSQAFIEFDRPNKDGLREIIATTFHHQHQPLIRLRTGEFIGPNDEAENGQELPWKAVRSFVGTSDEFLLSRSGRKVWPARFASTKSTVGKVVAAQYRQSEPGHLGVDVLATVELNANERKQVARYVKTAIGKGFAVTVNQVAKLQVDDQGTTPRVIRTLDPSIH